MKRKKPSFQKRNQNHKKKRWNLEPFHPLNYNKPPIRLWKTPFKKTKRKVSHRTLPIFPIKGAKRQIYSPKITLRLSSLSFWTKKLKRKIKWRKSVIRLSLIFFKKWWFQSSRPLRRKFDNPLFRKLKKIRMFWIWLRRETRIKMISLSRTILLRK